ncbi:MAG: TolC family protein [Deltaproteobacteria bacterium]|nr:TolC family protein [Deltaproteobacteria bacterium]MBW1952890.1 TolC family protein [Deltaproteobacteria bacterium]MBW1985888.1 TolC family protein [Deltaproteobacteria bacterium]MBW2133648.1 TolC family protein [Deltaproteobacteria bacterium]
MLTLKQAIEVALKNHPSIIEFREKAQAAKAQIGIARANYFPQLKYTSGYDYGTLYGGRTTDFDTTFLSSPSGAGSFYLPSRGGGPGDYFSHRFTLNQLLYDFGKTSGQVAESQANYQASNQDYANTRQQVVLKAKTAYFGYLAAKRAAEVSQKNVVLNQELVRQAQGFYKVGIRAKIDVAKAEANLYDAESALIQAKNTFKLSKVELMNALGLETWPYSDLKDILDVQPIPISLKEAKKLAFQRRPELLKNLSQQESSKAAVQIARSGYFPTLSAAGTHSWRGSDYPLREGWTIGVGVTFPLFEGLSTVNDVRRARSTLQSVEAKEQVIRQDITKEVEQSYLDLIAAAEKIRATAKALEAARENLRLARGRYQAGVGSIIEVTDAQVQFYDSELKHIRSLYDHKVAMAQLEKATGTPY